MSITYPGVYIDEVTGTPRVIEGVSTSVAAFVGVTSEGPVNEPVNISSTAQFQATFGPIDMTHPVAAAVALFFINGGHCAWVVRVTGSGAEGRPASTELIGSETNETGLHSLDRVDLINLLVVPDEADAALHKSIIDYAAQRRAIAILDLPADVTDLAAAAAWARGVKPLRHANAAAYFPRVIVADQSNPTGRMSVANSGAIAGIYARTDDVLGVWKAPAGSDCNLRGILGLSCRLNDQENGIISPLGLNALRSFSNGTVVWGARTLEGSDEVASEWKYVPVRRTALFIEESVRRGLRWVTFELMDLRLLDHVRNSVGAFLHDLFRRGAFKGQTAREAFYVHCAAGSEAGGEGSWLDLELGFAPLKPAEFVVLRLAMNTGFEVT